MPSRSKARDFVIGIDYDSIEEDKGHLTIRRKVPIAELVEEIKTIILKGSRFPQFPPAQRSRTKISSPADRDQSDREG